MLHWSPRHAMVSHKKEVEHVHRMRTLENKHVYGEWMNRGMGKNVSPAAKIGKATGYDKGRTRNTAPILVVTSDTDSVSTDSPDALHG